MNQGSHPASDIPFPLREGRLEVALILIVGISGAIVGIALYGLLWETHRAYSDIATAYALNARAGHGFVFNAGEVVLLLPAPLYLALLVVIPPPLLFALSAGLGGGAVFALARRQTDRLMAGLSAAFYVGVVSFGAGTAAPVGLGVALCAFLLMAHKRHTPAALCFALATLITVEIGLLVLVGIVWATLAGRGGTFILAYALPLGVGGAFLVYVYGEGLVGILISGIPSDTLRLIIVVGAAAPIVWVARHLSSSRRFFGVIPPLACLIVVSGVLAAEKRSSTPLTALPLNAGTVGIPRADDYGQYERTANQTLIAFDGRFQPDVFFLREFGDDRSIVIKYAPDVIALSAGFNPSSRFGTETLERLGYVSDGAWLRRTKPIGVFRLYAASILYTPDLTLQTYSLDRAEAAAGDILRIGLEWEVKRAATQPLSVTLSATNEDGQPLTTITDEIAAEILRRGLRTTYHALPLPQTAGRVVITLSLKLNSGTLTGYSSGNQYIDITSVGDVLTLARIAITP